jgi:hypothetical protein
LPVSETTTTKTNPPGKKKESILMKTKIRNSISGVFLIPLVVACVALLPSVQATPDPGAVGGVNNTADGNNALNSVGAGAQGNTAFGFNALTSLTSGDSNAAQGSSALGSCTVGNSNTGVGNAALTALTDGDQNVAVGNTALDSITTGNRNTGVGYGTLRSGNFSDNTAVGWAALLANTTGDPNVAVGSLALRNNTSGDRDNAVGFQALFHNNTGDFNNAHGSFALFNNVSGSENNAFGDLALFTCTGNANTAVGDDAGQNISTGSSNTCLGDEAGTSISTASGVVAIGVTGGNQTNRTFVRNLTNGQIQSFNGGTIKYVTSEVATGRLGVTAVVSSRRYKYDIKPMDKVSEGILALKPMTFRLKKEVDTNGFLGFGLIAEDVEKVNPDLVYHNEDGSPESVRYDEVWACLLNEFLKEHQKVEEQQASIADLKSTVALQQKGMEVLTAQLKEQAAQIQRVSTQVELNKPAPSTVANK